MGRKLGNLIKSLKLSRAREFNNITKLKDLSLEKKTPYGTWPEEWKTTFYKAYPRFQQVILPLPTVGKFDLYSTLLTRESCREFSDKPIELEQLGDLLYYSGGTKRILVSDSSDKRMYPSAGARYPLEIYPFILNVNRVKGGVYHYHLKTHSLELISKGPLYQQVMKQFHQPWIRKSGVLMVVSAVFDRTEMKYKDRGYRHILTEYGHLAQNFYLVGNALELGICSIGGFIDDGLNEILDLDGRVESVIGVVAIGSRRENKKRYS